MSDLRVGDPRPGAPSVAGYAGGGSLLIVFARAPVAGRVKTRLVPPLDPATAALVYEACLADVLAQASATVADVRILFDGFRAEPYFAQHYPRIPRAPQAAGDVGARMHHAFAAAFADGLERVAIIGSDAPTLSPRHLAEGLDALGTADLTLGPSEDGGYYLIGLRHGVWPVASALFQEIAWSTERVLAQTLQRASASGLRSHVLPRWYDIDRWEDLERARQDAREGRLAEVLRGIGRDGSATARHR